MKTKDLVLISMFTAIIACLGLIPGISVPGLPVPIVLQNLGIILAGCLLGKRLGTLSVVLFLLLVSVGAPILSGGRGGFGVFFGPSAGYLFSFILVAFLIGFFVEKLSKWNIGTFFIINVLVGVILCNLIGGAYMAWYLHQDVMTIYTSTLAFVPGDVLKSLIAAILAVRLRKTNVLNIA
ncbi:biotin transporter BioY [Macrococcus sp. DPC7161]|uniref:biotin transporter BioY n=1 Tax=Macrococcus sp. DPC7161 TaxID=2507060 RepID=UPI00100BA0BD|nr:biotin transporter BioY [Macrococcus sp. DPC7161]RXK18581.1 biotin transporter BioY [Macrococcus sp. DPC7161]